MIGIIPIFKEVQSYEKSIAVGIEVTEFLKFRANKWLVPFNGAIIKVCKKYPLFNEQSSVYLVLFVSIFSKVLLNLKLDS